MSANDSQVGGSHYKGSIQCWDYIVANNIGYLAGNVIKYVSRVGKKGDKQKSIEDIDKAMHYLLKLKEGLLQEESK